MNEDEKRGKFLSELRKRKKMTQQDLAELIHYTDKNISKWETGKSFPSNPNIISKLADIFEVTIEEIMYGEFKQEDNTDEINQNFHKEYINNYNRYIKTIRRIMLFVFFIIIVSFITIYFVYIRNSVKLYTARIDNPNIESARMTVLLTTKFNILSLDKLAIIDRDIEKISLYFKKNGKNILVFAGENHDYYIKDNHGYNEYHLEELIKGLCYLKIRYSDDTEEIMKFRFHKDYNNDNIFPKDNRISIQDSPKRDNNQLLQKLIDLGFEDKGALLEQSLGENVIVQYYKDNQRFYISIFNHNEVENLLSYQLEKEIMYEKMINESLIEKKKLSIQGEKNCTEEDCHTIHDYAKYIYFLKEK